MLPVNARTFALLHCYHSEGDATRRGQTEAEVVRGRLNYDVTNVVALVSRDIELEISDVRRTNFSMSLLMLAGRFRVSDSSAREPAEAAH